MIKNKDLKKAELKIKRRKKIINLIKRNISIPKISKELNIAKSTIYYHYKKIKGRKYKKTKIPEDDKIIGEFMGIFAGDGNFFFDKNKYQYRISIFLHAIDDKIYAEYIKELVKSNFNKKMQEYKRENLLTLRIYSKGIYNMIKENLNLFPAKTYNICIKKPLNKMSKEFLTYFVRGIIDTDGHYKKDGRIVLCLVSKKMVDQVSIILKKFSIDNKIYIRNKKKNEKTQYELIIPRRYAKEYINKVGFSNKRKMR